MLPHLPCVPCSAALRPAVQDSLVMAALQAHRLTCTGPLAPACAGLRSWPHAGQGAALSAQGGQAWRAAGLRVQRGSLRMEQGSGQGSGMQEAYRLSVCSAEGRPLSQLADRQCARRSRWQLHSDLALVWCRLHSCLEAARCTPSRAPGNSLAPCSQQECARRRALYDVLFAKLTGRQQQPTQASSPRKPAKLTLPAAAAAAAPGSSNSKVQSVLQSLSSWSVRQT